jgi:phage-related baseplate assembly protein
MAGSFTSVNLSRLPAPNVVEVIDFETILAAMLADLRARDSTFDALVESDPAYKVLEVAAFRETLIRQRVNEAARAVLLSYAAGADLDQLAALYSVARLVIDAGDPEAGIAPTMESDDDLRRRVQLAPEGFSVAGPEGAYVFHALGASPDVLDASATSADPEDIRAIVFDVLDTGGADPTLVDAMTAALDAAVWPGDVTVSLLSRTGSGVAGAPLVATVTAALSDDVRPLTDNVTVQSATIVPYSVVATVYTLGGPDAGLVLAEANARLLRYAEETHRIGRNVSLSAILAALHAEGVARVVLTSPVADIIVGPTEASYCDAITVTNGGVE